MNAYTAGILLSLAVYLAVGTWAGRKVRHLEDYFVAGRQAPTLLILGTLVASLLSTTAFLGEVGMAYSGYGALVLARGGRWPRLIVPGLRDIRGYQAMYRAFAAAIAAGRQPDMSLERAMVDQRLMDQIYASLDTPAPRANAFCICALK